jgi:hypothetical protein
MLELVAEEIETEYGPGSKHGSYLPGIVTPQHHISPNSLRPFLQSIPYGLNIEMARLPRLRSRHAVPCILALKQVQIYQVESTIILSVGNLSSIFWPLKTSAVPVSSEHCSTLIRIRFVLCKTLFGHFHRKNHRNKHASPPYY